MPGTSKFLSPKDTQLLYEAAGDEAFVDRYVAALGKALGGLAQYAKDVGLVGYLIEMRKRYGKFPRIATVVERVREELAWLNYEALSEVEEW